jgi:hypothetical protein
MVLSRDRGPTPENPDHLTEKTEMGQYTRIPMVPLILPAPRLHRKGDDQARSTKSPMRNHLCWAKAKVQDVPKNHKLKLCKIRTLHNVLGRN